MRSSLNTTYWLNDSERWLSTQCSETVWINISTSFSRFHHKVVYQNGTMRRQSQRFSDVRMAVLSFLRADEATQNRKSEDLSGPRTMVLPTGLITGCGSEA